MKKFLTSVLMVSIFVTPLFAMRALTIAQLQTDEASSVTASSAVVQGTFDPNLVFIATLRGPYYYLEYGTTDALGTSIELSPSLYTNGKIQYTLKNLLPSKKYYYRFVRKTVDIESEDPEYLYANVMTFTTLATGQQGTSLTQAQLEGLVTLGFTADQITKIKILFAIDTTPNPNPNCNYQHSITLRKGSSGASVMALQSALGITADGKFGPATATAVMQYQVMNSIKADGVIGATTGAIISGICSRATM